MKRRQGQRGSAIVESALVSLVLLCLVIGIFDFGQMLFQHQALVERARSSVRWGAIKDANDIAAIKNKFLYDQATVPVNARPFLGLSASNVTVVRSGTVGTDSDRLTLTVVNQPFRTVSPFISRARTGQPIRVSVPLGMFN